jgi:hypothetical protein
VMQKETDDKVAVEMIAQARQRFPRLTLRSFDKGFHSPQNQIDLKSELTTVVLPKKGRLSEVALAVVARNIQRLGAIVRSLAENKRGPYKIKLAA